MTEDNSSGPDEAAETERGERQQAETEEQQTETEERAETEEDRAAEEEPGVDVAVVTISERDSIETDTVGAAVVTGLKKAGHEIVARTLIETDHDEVQSTVSELFDRDDVDLIVTVGATGIEPNDVTLEAVEPLLEKELPAFRDLFHQLTYTEIETAAITSRAIGGVVEGTPVFCLPNNESAARLAVERLIAPQLARLLSLANGRSSSNELVSQE